MLMIYNTASNIQNCEAVGVITIAKILSGDINVFLTSGFDNAKSM